ncbi:hypothetical protein T4D_11278 [Trichinella pseudospiralis]|uniref:Uncharacterized protein n=1 Tax=Trichinella pseudospiralis TaxID=6337 RepID=A0A0V1G671_TRIPS|nr:hypothetical protein T4D_11278 [Trichinella pseudospiralis]
MYSGIHDVIQNYFHFTYRKWTKNAVKNIAHYFLVKNYASILINNFISNIVPKFQLVLFVDGIGEFFSFWCKQTKRQHFTPADNFCTCLQIGRHREGSAIATIECQNDLLYQTLLFIGFRKNEIQKKECNIFVLFTIFERKKRCSFSQINYENINKLKTPRFI